jgi:O-antigen/teichoic acid export membrane protein
MLGKTGFGELAIIQNTIGMFGTVGGFGLGTTATKFIAEYRGTDLERAGRVRALSSVTAWVTSGAATAGLFFSAPWLAAHALAAPHLTGLLRLSAAGLLLSGVNGAQIGALSGFECFKVIARINLIAGLVNVPMNLAGVYWDGLRGAVWAALLNLGLTWFLSHLAVRKECSRAGISFAYRGCWHENEILWRFSLPAVLAGVMVSPVIWLGCAVLVNQPGGYAEMGLYNAILRIKQVPEMILAYLMAPLLPVLSEQLGRNAGGEYARTLRYAFTISILVMVPISALQIAVPGLTLLPYGSQFRGHTGAVRWLMVHGLIIGLFSPVGVILSSMNKMWLGLLSNLLWAGAYLSLCFWFVPHAAAKGLAVALSGSHFAMAAMLLLYLLLACPAALRDVHLLRLSLLTALLWGGCVLLARCCNPITAGLGALSASAVYLAAVIGLGSKNK